jgi:ABC-type Fe3+-hydroxamate transport system substrate-binding protein
VVAELKDARGHVVPTNDYARVVSLNTVADPILLSIIEPGRLLAVSTRTRDEHPEGFRYAGRPSVDRSDDLETILALRPDLVVASKFADESFMARLREEDIQVFDLGDMRGVGTTVLNIRTLGALLRQPARAAQVEADYLMRLAALDAAVPDEAEAPGLYLSIYGDSLFGGTAGSSYADMLHYAGVHDLAEEHGYRDWPTFSPEQLLAIDPPLVITQTGMAAVICGHSTLQHLACCGEGGRIIEVPGTYHSDPGLGLVQAAAAVQRLVHPEQTPVKPDRAPSVRALQARGVFP